MGRDLAGMTNFGPWRSVLIAPVATTPKGKGVFPEDHVLSLGVFGMAGSPQADAAILSKDTDLLLAIGASFWEASCHAWDPRVGAERWMMQIDVDPREIGKNYPVDVALVGNAKPVLKELDFELRRETHWLPPHTGLDPRLDYVVKLKNDTPRCFEQAAMECNDFPRPQRIIAELRRAIPSDGILFVDIGNVMAWALHYFQVQEPGTFFINMGFGSMGHAVAGAIGGKMAAKDRPVVALVGDASFAMNGMEVHTAVENNIPVVWVVMNNGGHGMVHLGESIQFKGKFNTSVFSHRVDAAGIAEAVGALAFRVERPGEVETAVRAAIKSGRPSVVDVRADIRDRPPMGIRLATLERFFRGR